MPYRTITIYYNTHLDREYRSDHPNLEHLDIDSTPHVLVTIDKLDRILLESRHSHRQLDM
eukprot:scaffold8732_cov87-Cylindrotheca_fusiformis.AAC.7